MTSRHDTTTFTNNTQAYRTHRGCQNLWHNAHMGSARMGAPCRRGAPAMGEGC